MASIAARAMEEEGSDEQDSGEGLAVSGSTDGQDLFNPTAKILLSCSPLFTLPSPDQLARCSADRKGPTHVFRAREGETDSLRSSVGSKSDPNA